MNLRWFRVGAVCLGALGLGACTTSFEIPPDATVADASLRDAALDAGDAVRPDDAGVHCDEGCPCGWRGRSPDGTEPGAQAAPTDSGPFQDPEYGTCLRRVGESGGQWLTQVTPSWVVSESWSSFIHTERLSGNAQSRGVHTRRHGYWDEDHYGYFRPFRDGDGEGPGLNSFCGVSRSRDTETCVAFDVASWEPALMDAAVARIRHTAVAIDGAGFARRWAALVEGESGTVLGTFDSPEQPFRQVALPPELVVDAQTELQIDPSGEWVVVIAGERAWRFRQSASLEFVDSLQLGAAPRQAVLLLGPTLVYDLGGRLWFSDFDAEPALLSDAGAAPCGQGSVLCEPVNIALAPAPGARPGWVTVAFHGPERDARTPWAAGHLALVPLREEAPIYSLGHHRTSVRLHGPGWRFTVGWDAEANELMWRSDWDGSLEADTLMAARLPSAWWGIDR